MAFNPYKTQGSEVNDLQKALTKNSLKPPWAPFLAGALLAISFILAIPRFAFGSIGSNHVFPIVASLLALLLSWFVMSSVYKSRNWARWIFIVFGVSGVIGIFFVSLPEATPFLIKAINFTQNLMQCTATVLFLLPDSKKWFTLASNA
jgi:hypothetical protein